MDKKTVEEIESEIGGKLKDQPCPVDEILELIAGLPSGKGELQAVALLTALGEAGDFPGALKTVRQCKNLLAPHLKGASIRDALKRTTKDRLIISFIDSVGFDVRPNLVEPLGRLERLVSFHPGAFVLSRAWGLGKVARIDAFYRRIVVDFHGRRGHQLTYDAACETLELAPEKHVLVTLEADPAFIAQQIREQPGAFVLSMLKSFGNMPVTRLEELINQHGFAKYLPDAGKNKGDKAAKWKAFWEKARAELRANKLVEIPTRRAEAIVLKASVEDYGDTWFTAFAQETDPKTILASVNDLRSVKSRFEGLNDEQKEKVADRLRFALKGARGIDPSLYSRLAFCLDDLGLDAETVTRARNYLWTNERYLDAARVLPARDMGQYVVFLTAAPMEEAREALRLKLYAVLPQMCFPFLSATLDVFKKDPACEQAAAALLKTPHAPATLVTYILGRYSDFQDWQALPPLVVVLTHAIALGEGKQTGETLRMQNVIRRLFADQKWLEGIFAQLKPVDQALFFERFQASISWDPSTHHMIVVRMTKIVPELAERQIKVAAPQKIERITSLRSYAERQAAYEKLVNVDIPENTKRIEFARSYGDLSENAEYQYAKDEQRALLQKQTLMQDDLNNVKATDFTGIVSETVCPGTMVTIVTATGDEKVFTVLGEWDNDLEKGVISNKTKLAQNLLGKKAGETFDLPDAEGNVSVATIKSVDALSDEMLAWCKAPVAV